MVIPREQAAQRWSIPVSKFARKPAVIGKYIVGCMSGRNTGNRSGTADAYAFVSWEQQGGGGFSVGIFGKGPILC